MSKFSEEQLMRMFPPLHVDHIRRARTYDVRITLNKSGSNKANVVRFGFINQGAKAISKYRFVEVSDILYTKDRIYFRGHDEKLNKNIHMLSTNSERKEDSCYFAITPTCKAEKAYRMNWIGKTYALLYDEENDLYYVENAKGE